MRQDAYCLSAAIAFQAEIPPFPEIFFSICTKDKDSDLVESQYKAIDRSTTLFAGFVELMDALHQSTYATFASLESLQLIQTCTLQGVELIIEQAKWLWNSKGVLEFTKFSVPRFSMQKKKDSIGSKVLRK